MTHSTSLRFLFLTKLRLFITIGVWMTTLGCFNVSAVPLRNAPPEIHISCTNETFNTNNISPYYFIANRHVVCSAETNDPEGDSVMVLWDFGDGSEIADYGTHAYSESDTYTITAYATDGINETSTSLDFNAIGYEKIRLNCESDNMTVTCSPVVLESLALSSGTFDWGDGSISHVGKPDPSNSSASTQSSSSSSSSSNYSAVKNWTFDTPITHTYAGTGAYDIGFSYNAGLQQGKDYATVNVTGLPNQEPSLHIDCQNESYNIEQFSPFSYTVKRYALCSAETQNIASDPLTVRWDFGDGSPVGSWGGQHVYKESGYYLVTAYITDGTQELSTRINFYARGAENYRLNCSTNNMTVTCKPVSVSGIAAYTGKLSWGDGTASYFGYSSSASTSSASSVSYTNKRLLQFDEPVSHTYAGTGAYNIRFDYAGNYEQGSDSTIVDINGIDISIIDASVSCRKNYIDTTVPTRGAIDLFTEVFVCDVNMATPHIADVSILWDAGDGSDLIKSTQFSHVYKTPGNYMIKAFISNELATAEFDTSIEAIGNGEAPTVTLSCDSRQKTVSCTIIATDSDTGTLSAMVGWGDGEPDIYPVLQENVAHTYAADDQGEKSIFVTVFDGATANTAVSSIVLDDLPETDISCDYKIVSEWPGYFLGQVTLTNNGTHVLSSWDVALGYSNDSKIVQHWGSELSGSNPYLFTALSWNGQVLPAQSVSFGFIGTHTDGQSTVPTIGGTTCSHH